MQYFYCIILKKEVPMAKKRMTFTLDEELLDKLKETSEETMIPQAKIVQKAIEKQLKEMGK